MKTKTKRPKRLVPLKRNPRHSIEVENPRTTIKVSGGAYVDRFSGLPIR